MRSLREDIPLRSLQKFNSCKPKINTIDENMNLTLYKNIHGIIAKLTEFFSNREDVGFAYLFGSIARNQARPLSDIDIAVYLREAGSDMDLFQERLKLLHQLFALLRTEKVDLILLNNSPIELNYRILKSGRLVSENDPREKKAFYEKTIRDYLDLSPILQYRDRIIRQKMREGSYFD